MADSHLEAEADRLDKFACAAIPGILIRHSKMNAEDVAAEAYRVALAAEQQREKVLSPRGEADAAAENLIRTLDL